MHEPTKEHLEAAWNYVLNVSFSKGYNAGSSGQKPFAEWFGDCQQVVEKYYEGYNMAKQ